jgi:hypothetical protein
MKLSRDLAHDQMIAAARGVINDLGLNDSVSVPPYGSRIRISKALNDTLEYPGEVFHADHFDLVDLAFSRFGIGRPHDRIDECAMALFNILYNQANLRAPFGAACETRSPIKGYYVRLRDGQGFKFFGSYTSAFPAAWEAYIWYAEDKPHDVLKDAREKLYGPLLDLNLQPCLLHDLAFGAIEQRIEICRTI